MAMTQPSAAQRVHFLHDIDTVKLTTQPL